MKPLLPLTFVLWSGGNSPRQWVPHNLFGKRNTSQNETYQSNTSHLSIILTPIWPINVLHMIDKCVRPFTLMRWGCCSACSRITNVHVPWTRRINEQHLHLHLLVGICLAFVIRITRRKQRSLLFVWQLPINIVGGTTGDQFFNKVLTIKFVYVI